MGKFYQTKYSSLMIRQISLLLCLFMGTWGMSQTTLALGDVAVTGYNGDGNPDSYSIVLLTDIEANTVISFTDHGWLSSGGFRTNEGTLVATFTAAHACGTNILIDDNVVTVGGDVAASVVTTSGGPNLASGGDQLFVYQGTVGSPTLITGIQMNGGWDSNASDSNTSAQPPGFMDGVNSLSISPERDNAAYDCSTLGSDANAIRTAVNNAANWDVHDSSTFTLASCSFVSCSSISIPVCPMPGDLVITEIMQSPSSLPDSQGEYFEIYNASANDLELEGMVVSDDGSDDFTVVGSLVIGAGEYMVFGVSAAAAPSVDYIYTYGNAGMFLSGSDELILAMQCVDFPSMELDKVAWDGGPNFPDPDGASMNLSSTKFADDNNDGANWCESTSIFVNGIGTPGAANDDCDATPACSITNVVVDPAPVCDGTDIQFIVNFSVVSGTGMYEVVDADDGTVYGSYLFGGPSGNYFINATIDGPVVAGDVNIKVQTTDETCESSAIEITVPDCPAFEPDPTMLCLGDIAFTGYVAAGTSSSTEKWSFVLLKDVGSTTKISFTDKGWRTGLGFTTNEGTAVITFSRPAACGTELVVAGTTLTDASGTTYGTATNSVALAGSGDQLFAYQGDEPTADDMSGFLAAIQMNSGQWEPDATGTNSNTSALPCILEEGLTAVAPAAPERDNGNYNCAVTTGTPAELRAAVNDAANWLTDNSIDNVTVPSACGFTCDATPCELPEITEVTVSSTGDCPDDIVTLTVVGTLGDATEWHWYTDCCSGTSFTTGTSIEVSPSENTTYYVRGLGGCVDVSKCQEDAIEVDALVDNERPSFNGTCGDLDQTVSATTGECGTEVFLPAPTVTDNCNDSPQLRARSREIVDGDAGPWSSWSADPSGYYAVGVYEIQWRARDGNGNSRRCKHDLVVTDDEAPELECMDITIVFNGEDFQLFEIGDIATYSDNCGIDNTDIDLNFVSCSQIDQVFPVNVTVEDVNGLSNTCVANVTVDGLPCKWYTDGHVDCDGEDDYIAATETFSLSSDGCANGITNEDDQYAFIQQTVCGNTMISAEITSVTGSTGWAGVTMRESNDPDSKMVSLMFNGSSNHRREVRSTTGGNVTSQLTSAFNREWVRIRRVGNSFRGYTSSNGSSWFLRFSVSVPMDQCLELGLIVNSYAGSGQTNATFENVDISGGTSPAPLQERTGGEEEMTGQDRNGQTYDLETASGNTLKAFTVYPNPSFGEVELALGEFMDQAAILNVIDGYGRVVKAQNLGVIETATMSLNLRQLPAGVYAIQLHLADGTVSTQRVILQPRP